MNLTFGICWIEDQASDAERDSVELAVRSSGFEPDIHLIDSEDEIRAFATRQEHFQEFDLILLDLRLSPRLRGDDLAPSIRNSFRSTPILFYSAVSESELRNQMARKNVDGVYCANRRGLSARVGELVSGLAPALNRLSGMRGLAARVVAECDQELRKILSYMASGKFTEIDIVKSLKQRLCKSKKRQKERLRTINALSELLEDRSMSSGILFEEVYSRINQPGTSDEIRAVRRELRHYARMVLSRRNILAHALEERTDEGWRIVRGATKPDLTAQDFQNFRSEFLSHLQQVRELRELVVSHEPD